MKFKGLIQYNYRFNNNLYIHLDANALEHTLNLFYGFYVGFSVVSFFIVFSILPLFSRKKASSFRAGFLHLFNLKYINILNNK